MGPLETLPALHSPDDVGFLTGSGSGSGSGLRWAVAVVDTARAAAELEAHYSSQLEAAGWLRRDRGGSGPLAWSTWDVPGRLDWQGTLYVVEEPGKRRRTVYLQAASDLVKAAPPPVLEQIRRVGNTVIT